MSTNLEKLLSYYEQQLKDAQKELAEAQDQEGLTPGEYYSELGYAEGQRDTLDDIVQDLKQYVEHQV